MKSAVTIALLLVPAFGFAWETNCEETAKVAARLAIEEHEGGLTVVDKTTAHTLKYATGRRRMVWLQARYLDEERRPTNWCVFLTLPEPCTDAIFSGQPPAKVNRIVSCPLIPDDVLMRKLLKQVGWPPQ